jgi:serine phosphatase RsbU (regulator of sigma subunit)/anti-sigma regulatory factor (Ser/Thr protein kinase)/putative methionine-R-sulfoxide reductase with GAF domain
VARAAKGVEEEVRQGVRIPVGKGFAGTITAEVRPIVIPELKPGDVLNPILLEVGIRSLMGVPLVVEGRVVGVLHVGTLKPRDFGDEDSALLQLAGDRIAIAIDHARLYEAERRARAAAERAAERIERLQAITEVALAHLALDDELLNEMLARVRDNLGVDTAAILLLDSESNMLVARAARGLEEEVDQGVRLPLGEGFAGRIAATGAPVLIEDVRHGDVLNPILRTRGIRSLLGVPLLVEGRVIGVLHVGSLTPRRFSGEDSEFLQAAADRIAVALEHARLYEREHLVARSLQRSLLPDRLPRVPGLELAARYRPGEGEAELGGDWYDAVVLPDGRIGVALGDVVSRGLRAASVTAQLRNALRAYALDGHSPSVALTRLSRVARALERKELATLLYLVIDPATGTVVLSSAGHPPPLVVEADGTASFLDVPTSVPLGALSEPRYEEIEKELEPGCTLMAYTDGLVERRDMWLDEGMDRLRAVAEDLEGGIESFCDGVLRAMLQRSPTDDDIALIAVQRTGVAVAEFGLDVPADATELAPLRRALRGWLAEVGVASDESYEMVVATTEAAANAVEHAYGPIDATFRVEAELEDGEVAIRVTDTGHWRPPRGTNRGRGTLLMQQLMDAFEVVTGDGGTEVRMRKRISRQEEAA